MALRRRSPTLVLAMAYLLAASFIARALLAGSDPAPAAALGPPLPTATPALVLLPLYTAAPTATPTSTVAPTATATATITPTATSTPTATPTATATPTSTPTAGPTPEPVHVLRTYPIDGDTDIQAEAPLRIVFDQPMDTAPGAVSVEISPSVPFALEWPVADCLVVRAGPWQLATPYRLTLQAARSTQGGGLARPLVLSFARGDRGAPIPILMYHHVEALVGEASPERVDLTVSPYQFASQLDFLAGLGAHVVPLGAVVDYLERGQPLPAHPVVLTFDDGYRSVYVNAVPALQARGLTATLFIIAGSTSYSAFMDAAQLKELVQAGFTVGSHGFDHIRVQALTAAQAERQLGQSRRVLEEITGAPVVFFAYPGGWYSDGAAQQLAAYGYRAAVAVSPLAYQQPSRLFKLPRIHTPYAEPLEKLRDRLPWKE